MGAIEPSERCEIQQPIGFGGPAEGQAAQAAGNLPIAVATSAERSRPRLPRRRPRALRGPRATRGGGRAARAAGGRG